MEQSCDNWSTASESRSTCRNRSRARLRRSAFWVSLARGICHKHTTVYDTNQRAPDFCRNSSRRSNSKLSFAFGESLPRPVAFPSSAGSIGCLRPAPDSVPQLAPATTSGSTSGPTGPRPACVHTPEVGSVESNRNSLSGPRHTRLDTRPANDRVSPRAPDGPSEPVGTHTNNPGNLPQKSAPGLAGLPFALPGRAPSVFPTASAFHSPLVCTRVEPPAACKSSCAALPESLPEIPLRLGPTARSARS